jgi:V8-like Glu-specific endopeptidase
VHERFSSGFSTSPVPNTSSSFIGAGYDFSGVGWQASATSLAVTLISPQNFVTARHVAPANGSTVTFLNQDGALKSYTVSSTSTISYNGQSSDLVVGTLSAAIPNGDRIASYPILYNGTPLSTINLTGYTVPSLLVYGQGGRIGTNTIDGFINGDLYPLGAPDLIADSLYFYTDFDAVTGQTQGQGGDSGSPTFAPIGGILTLVGVHSAIGNVGGNPNPITFDNFLAFPSILNQISSVTAASSQTVTLYVTAIPEPAACASLVGALFLGIAAYRRRTGLQL